MKRIQGSITSVPGFRASGVCAGIKKGRSLDLALIVSQVAATAVGCMTRNRFKAAPLQIARAHLKKGRGQAILVNSGNANACTGKRGYQDARDSVRWVGEALGIPPSLVYVASTGVIGEPLPALKIKKAIPKAARVLSRSGGRDAATAMMTTDTVPKTAAVRIRLGGTHVTVGGIAKGAGMIHPRLATMLAFVGTDASIGRAALDRALRAAVNESFNRISVDGDTSTNDLVLCLANGLSEISEIRIGGKAFGLFCEALREVCQELARMIIRDGEGATRFVTLKVRGAPTPSHAGRVAESVARSLLFKTALFGADPNWGRIMAAIGASGVAVPESRVAIWIGGVPVVKRGIGTGKRFERLARRFMKRREVALDIDLGMGKSGVAFHTTDLSENYVRINANYRT